MFSRANSRCFLKLQAAHAVGDPLDGVLDGVGKVIHGVDAPLVPLAVVVLILDAVDGGVAHIHVGAGQVDLGPQGLFPLLEFARPHPAEEIEVFLGGAVPPGGGAAGLAGVAAAVLPHLVAGQIVHIGLALPDQLFGVFIALLEVIAAVKDAAVGVGAQPVQVLQNAVDILDVLAGGVGVVQPEVELAAVRFGDGPVDIDGLGAADVQVAVGLGRETGMDLADLALGQVGVNDLGQKVFVSHSSDSPSYRHLCSFIMSYDTTFFAFLQGGAGQFFLFMHQTRFFRRPFVQNA